MSETPAYSPEQIMERAEAIRKVRALWKGHPNYAAALDMEIWALTTAAQLIKVCRQTVTISALKKGIDLETAQRDALAMQACERIAEIL